MPSTSSQRNFQIDDIDQQSRVGWAGCFTLWLQKIAVGVDRRSREELGSAGVIDRRSWLVEREIGAAAREERRGRGDACG
jgi:hypothetical protein